MTGPEGLCSGSRTEVISQELEGATSDLSPVYCDLQGQARQPGEKAHAALPPPSGQCTDRPIIKLAYQPPVWFCLWPIVHTISLSPGSLLAHRALVFIVANSRPLCWARRLSVLRLTSVTTGLKPT